MVKMRKNDYICTIYCRREAKTIKQAMNIRPILCAALLCAGSAAPLSAQTLPYQNPSLSAHERAVDLCSRLTLEEKAALMQSSSPAIERLGIPQFDWWNEALQGVARNGYATVYPATIGMAASFDDALLYRVYSAVSDEARVKANQARHSGRIKRYQSLSFWTPNINIFRDPRWGRGQETYGEDPYLTTRMGLAVVRGLQGPEDTRYRKLLACAKHFAVHSGPEWNRHEFNIESLPERDLWETYLPAFKTLVQDGHVAEVMCAYQRIDGDPCCGNTRYLQHILRDQWGFKGLVTSDCGAVDDFWKPGRHGVSANAHAASAKAVRSGTDVECGSNYRTLPEAVAAGEISEQEVDVSLIRLLQARFELGDFDPEELVDWQRLPESKLLSAENKQLALDMARESMTLLQNRSNLLPLSESGQKILVMGPNANDSVMQWANYYGYPTATTTILEGIRDIAGNVDYYGSCGLTRNEVQESRFGEISYEGHAGMKATYYNNKDFSGSPAAERYISEPIRLSNGGNTVFAPGVNLENFSARYEGTFTPSRSEDLQIGMAFDDCARLIVNGDTLIDVWKGRNRVQFANKTLHVEAGQRYQLQVDYQQGTDMAVMMFDLFHKYTPTEADIVKATEGYDVVVFVGGISPTLEGEEMKVSEPGFKGGDRTDIELPQAQRDILSILHKAGRKVVLVNCSGSAIGLEPETQHCDAILQAWYPGEAGGQAVAEVLFGRYNPSGKLPITFYRHVSDLPDFLDYRMQGRTYRYFGGDALFAFGHGLSYTTFEVSDVRYKKGQLTATVKNTGTKKGTETVQVYFKRTDDKNGPIKTLCDFEKVTLEPGASKTLHFSLSEKQLESWDSESNTMRFVPGKYELMVGNSSETTSLRSISVKLK